MDIFNDLQNRIKMDFSDRNTKRVRNALKLLDVKTKIPHRIANDAILCSKLYAIDFLQNIKEYLKTNVISKTSSMEK